MSDLDARGAGDSIFFMNFLPGSGGLSWSSDPARSGGLSWSSDPARSGGLSWSSDPARSGGLSWSAEDAISNTDITPFVWLFADQLFKHRVTIHAPFLMNKIFPIPVAPGDLSALRLMGSVCDFIVGLARTPVYTFIEHR
jgi:hypothetical protein